MSVPITPLPLGANVPPAAMALVIAIAAAVFVPALGVGFLGDDFVYIARFREMSWSEWPALFIHEWSGGVWGQPLKELRPFAALSFMIDARLWGGHVVGYRLVNLSLHLATTAIVMLLAWRYGGGRGQAAVIAGLAFAVHPSHVETVTWITGRPDLLGTFAALAFFAAGETFSTTGKRGFLFVALAALFVGVFTKEFCLIIPVLLALRWVLLDLRAGRSIWLRRGGLFLGALAVVAVYTVARRAAFGDDPTTGFFGWNDGPAWNRQAAYWGWLIPILPFTTADEWAALPPMAALRSWWIVAAIIVMLLFAITLWRAKSWAHAIFFGGVWWLATTVGLFVAVYFSPRHLYLPTAGVAIGLGLALRSGRISQVIATGILVWSLAAHLTVLKPWRAAGRVSNQVLAAVRADLANADANSIVLLSVPEKFGPVLLWAWSSPHALGAPFVTPPVPPTRIVERVVNYVRSERYLAEHQPLEIVRAAREAIAVHVDSEGHVHHRRLSREELQMRGDQLAALFAQGINPENLSGWLKSCAMP
jgi:hypothetical protein